MPISNYQVPGVYVTQSGTALTAINPTNLNVLFLVDQPVAGANTDTFNNVVAASGITIGQLSIPMVNNTTSGTYSTYSGYTVTWVSGSTTVTGTYGVNFAVSTPSGSPFSFITTSGVSAAASALPSGTVSVTYGHNWGAYGTYYNFNSLSTALGAAVSGTSISSPATLAAQLAFQNGANTVQVLPVARVSSSGTLPATTYDWTRSFSTTGTGNDPTYLASFSSVDVVVPLYGFVNTSGTQTVTPFTSGTVAYALASYLANQSLIGNYQRAFVGVDGTAGQVTSSGLQALASGFGNTSAGTRVSLVFPSTINYNPGLSTLTGLTNVNFNIPGYYLAAALAGTFVGQADVMVPITNKIVAGFNYIPNQIGLNDAATNYLPYGITTAYQKRDGNIYVLQGLTTNVTNWLTQEISLNAIGDRLAGNISQALNSSQLIGGPLTQQTVSTALSTVQATLIQAKTEGLIQSYQNLTYSLATPNPTTVYITFQYSPTYPINYIQVTFSLNTATGTVVAVNTPSNTVVS
jgi:hypothetical protein